MKTAIYIEDGRTQLVLTPETDFEKGLISKVNKGEQETKIYIGGFYPCQGGWTRHSEGNGASLIIVMDMKN